MKRSTGWLLAALAIGVLALALGRAYTARQHATPAIAGAAAMIELAASDVAPAKFQEITQGLPVSGTLKAVNSAIVKARVAGELQALTVREGDTVTAGQVLARIDAVEYQSRLQQAQQQADAALAQVDIAQRQFANNKALVDQGFISKTALDTSLANLQGAQATHKAALAAADIARKSLDDTVLKAPIAGQISQRLAQPGERVGVDTRILEIVDLRRLELEATLAAIDTQGLQPGQTAKLRVEGAGAPVMARLARINPSAQAGNRSVLVYLSIEQPQGPALPLRQGLFAEGTLSTGSSRQLAVPVSSVRTDQVLPFVQLVVQGKVQHQSVVLGRRGMVDTEAMVGVEGLKEGDAVIRGSTGLLRPGSTVQFTPVGAASPAPAAPAAQTAR